MAGIASIIAALAAGYWGIRTARQASGNPAGGPEADAAASNFVSAIFGFSISLATAVVVGGYIMRAIALYQADRRYDEVRTRVQAAEDALQVALESQDQNLALQRIWAVVHERLEQYHQDAQRQGRIAFSRAMGAMSLGFLILAACVAATFFATSAIGIVVTGSLGAISAGVAGYVSQTYLRAYQDSAIHLRAYFAQPVEASRFLFAERAIAVSGLPDADRAELMKVLVHAMVAGGLGKASETQ
ncbi:hypothetical protein [Promicromonospora aerolata]|uniref:SMODS and SLOG-associating 2TM effector domain-containing protein n=1 Tax=Promicromonospora aerolata TaxID=195749 RepID=A0ABW4V1R8_9MICO